jgi:GDP-4-dehydro-6-deoxy-D-mannose reductase
VVGVLRRDSPNIAHIEHGPALIRCDIASKAQLADVVRSVGPEVIFHLAAQSLPLVSWREPEATFQTNVVGTLNLLDAVRASGRDSLVVIAGSSAEYGPREPRDSSIKEDTPLRPASPYGVSKVGASLLALMYRRVFGMRVIIARPFFVIGTRKVGDVCSDFARGVAAVERGDQSALKVGNLETIRDFLDVDDAVRAFWLLTQKGAPGHVYNVCSGEGHKVRTVLELLLGMGSKTIPLEYDPMRERPVDEPVVIGDNSSLRVLGWAPRVSLNDSLSRILNYWRSQVPVS